ncbi:MAG: PaeR7I family type II restriction endonuclease [Tepidisphaerales bacterium]
MDWESQLRQAVRHFWRTRQTQADKQGSATGQKDAGARSAVTGGRQMDGFVEIIRRLLVEGGLDEAAIHVQKRVDLPGFFRAEKSWDLLVVFQNELLGVIEFKSQIGPSFGNNFNNRTEEAIGSATDLWTAYREGAFRLSARPWLGYLMLLEETERSTTPVRCQQSHFPVFPEFHDASYSRRYEILLTRLVRERLYDAACLLLSPAGKGAKGDYSEPAAELAFRSFAESLLARVIAAVRTK